MLLRVRRKLFLHFTGNRLKGRQRGSGAAGNDDRLARIGAPRHGQFFRTAVFRSQLERLIQHIGAAAQIDRCGQLRRAVLAQIVAHSLQRAERRVLAAVAVTAAARRHIDRLFRGFRIGIGVRIGLRIGVRLRVGIRSQNGKNRADIGAILSQRFSVSLFRKHALLDQRLCQRLAAGFEFRLQQRPDHVNGVAARILAAVCGHDRQAELFRQLCRLVPCKVRVVLILQQTQNHRQELCFRHEFAVTKERFADALDKRVLVAIADIGTGPGQNVRKRMLRVLFLRFRFRAEQADDQGDRLFARQRLFQLEALVCALKQAKGLQRFGLLQRRVAMAASGGQRRNTAQEHRKQQQDCNAGFINSFHKSVSIPKIVRRASAGERQISGAFAGGFAMQKHSKNKKCAISSPLRGNRK